MRVCLWPWPTARGHTEPTFCSPFPSTLRGNTLLCLCFRGLHCSVMWERQRRRREIELIFYFPWQFRGFYELKEKTPQSQQMVVGICVFLTICNSPHLEMFCGHPLCPQDCICPHIIKVCIENSLALLARYKCFDTGTAPPSHQTQSRRFTFQNTTPSIYLFFIYPAKWIFFLSLALKPSILLPQRGASVRCR